MPTDVDTDRGGQLGGRSRGERQVRCRLPFRQAEARCEPRCVIAPSASHTRQSHHSPASRLCAQTGRSPPSGRAGEPGGSTGGGGASERDL